MSGHPNISLHVLPSDTEVAFFFNLDGINISFGSGFEINDITLPHEQHEFILKPLQRSGDFEASLSLATNLDADVFVSEIFEVVTKIGQFIEQFIIDPSSILRNEDGYSMKKVRFSGSKAKIIMCKTALLRGFDKHKLKEPAKLVLSKEQLANLHKCGILKSMHGAPHDAFISELSSFVKILLEFRGSSSVFDEIKVFSRSSPLQCVQCQQRPGVQIEPDTCEHAYCQQCLTQAVRANKAALFCCPACGFDDDASPIPVSMHVLRLMLTEGDFAIAAQKALQGWLKKEGGRFTHCRHEGCGLLVRLEEEKTMCPGCLETIN